MHRQSLGSPGSKLAQEKEKEKEEKTKSPISDENNAKSQKLAKPPLKPERFLHVIPLLTVVCFLVLYLSSHNPSQTDLAGFSGFKWPAHNEDMKEIDGLNVEWLLAVERNDVLGIRSLKNLNERKARGSEYRLHRKIAHF